MAAAKSPQHAVGRRQDGLPRRVAGLGDPCADGRDRRSDRQRRRSSAAGELPAELAGAASRHGRGDHDRHHRRQFRRPSRSREERRRGVPGGGVRGVGAQPDADRSPHRRHHHRRHHDGGLHGAIDFLHAHPVAAAGRVHRRRPRRHPRDIQRRPVLQRRMARLHRRRLDRGERLHLRRWHRGDDGGKLRGVAGPLAP